MENLILNGQISGGAAALLNIETISEGLDKNCIEYADFFGEFIKAKTNITITHKNIYYTIGIRKDELSGEYVIMAWDYELFDVYEKNLGFKVMSGMNVVRAMRAVAEAVLAIAEDIQDYIDRGCFMSNAMAVLESRIEDATEGISDVIDEAKDTIDGLAEQNWWDIDEDGIKENISEACERIMDCLNEIGLARQNFIEDLSDYYECDFTLYDAYSDVPVIDLGCYYNELDYFNVTDAFEEIMNYIFEYPADHYQDMDGAEDLLSLRDTLYHYLAVA